MPLYARRRARLAFCIMLGGLISACGSMDRVSAGIASIVSPYKVAVVQGNFVSKEQVQLLQPGMSRQQVTELLGTPLLTSLFHADRWEYAFTLRSRDAEPINRKLTVFFKGDTLERFEGDEMFSEAEFADKFTSFRKGKTPVPVLEASEESLKAFAQPARNTETAAAAPPPRSTAYPPLEPVPQ